MSRIFLALGCALIFGVPDAYASVNGFAVGSKTSATLVGAVVGGETEYYIPLDETGATSGTYDVTAVPGGNAGMFSDSGTGFGHAGATGLNMFYRYDLSGEFNPSTATEISFVFDDLDLADINDPNGFLESFRVGYFDDAGVEQELAGVITDLSDGFASLASGVTATLSTLGGTNDPLTITFAGSGLTSIVNSVADAGGFYDDEFYLNLHFGSLSTGGSNTPEELMSSAMTQAVPEPGTAAIWSFLAIGAMFYRKRS